MSRAELLKPADVCAQLKVSRAWLYRAAADGRIPSLRLGGPDGPVRFEPREIAAWLERSRASWQPGDSGTATLRRVAPTSGSATASGARDHEQLVTQSARRATEQRQDPGE
jgi:excisionase family DNA binding protein